LNHFADLTDEEYKKGFMTMIPIEKINKAMEKFLKDPVKNKVNFDLMADADEDESLNNRTNNIAEKSHQQLKVNWSSYMSPGKDQGFCGSCWAFCTMGAIEGNYNIKYGKSLDFSEQELVDCDYNNKDCSGGSPDYAIEYIMKNGIAYSNEYPYISGISSEKDVCRSSFTSRNKIVENYEYCEYENCSKDKFYSMLQNGPMIVFVDADGGTEAAQLFKFYTEGIIENMPCVKPTHGVVLFGTDYDDKGQYLIARNSWGPGWGEDGNYKIRVNPTNDTCMMEKYGIRPIVKMTNIPVPPKPVPGCLKLYSECGLKGHIGEICGNTQNLNFPFVQGFHLGKFKKAKIFGEDKYCMGRHVIIDKSVGCFDTVGLDFLKGNFKSIIVEDERPPHGCIWVYKQNCLSGEKLEICSDVPDLNKMNFGNRISSFILGPGVSEITVFLDINYRGNFMSVNTDINGMEGMYPNKNIESIKITKN